MDPEFESLEEPDLLNRILDRLPCFRGYADQQARQESDLRTRHWIADRFDDLKGLLDDVLRRLIDEGNLDVLSPVDRVRGQVDRLAADLRGAPAGYGPIPLN
jgi:hypothetical protein